MQLLSSIFPSFFPSFSSSSSSSSSSSTAPSTLRVCEWALDSRPIFDAVNAAIGQTSQNPNAFLLCDLVKLVVIYLQSQSVFSAKEWETFFGKVDPSPEIPLNIENIWQSQCPVFRQKRVYETHMLVYIPATVNNKPLTLKSIGEVTKRYFSNTTEAGYRCPWDAHVAALGDKSIDRSYWVLMTKDILPHSGDQDNSGHAYQARVMSVALDARAPYAVPRTLEAAICILAQRFSFPVNSKTGLLDSHTFTLCQEKIQGRIMIVGGLALNKRYNPFFKAGLYINYFTPPPSYDIDRIGVAPVRKL